MKSRDILGYFSVAIVNYHITYNCYNKYWERNNLFKVTFNKTFAALTNYILESSQTIESGYNFEKFILLRITGVSIEAIAT